MHWLNRLFLGTSLITAVSASPRFDEVSPEVACNFRSIVALGDSYAAGLQSVNASRLSICPNGGAGGYYSSHCTNTTCARDTASYSWQFATAHKLRGNYGYFACSGADTANIQWQSNKIQTTPDLITINMGGNNNNIFANVVQWCVYEHIDYSGYCREALKTAYDTIKDIDKIFNRLLTLIRLKYPNATIAVLGYAQFYASGSNYGCDWDQWFGGIDIGQDSANTLNELVRYMNSQISKEASKFGYYVDIDSAFAGHRFCESNYNAPYFHYVVGSIEEFKWYRGMFHPTPAGQNLMFQALSKKLGCSLTREGGAAEELTIQVEL